MWLLCTGARDAAFRNIKTIAECLADELINAAKVCACVQVIVDTRFKVGSLYATNHSKVG